MARGAAGVGDEDVDPPEVLDRAVDDRLARLALLDVTGDEVDAIAGVQCGERLLRLARVATVDDDERSLVEEPLRDAEADASRPTGDTGNAPVQYSHDHPLMSLGRSVWHRTTSARELGSPGTPHDASSLGQRS